MRIFNPDSILLDHFGLRLFHYPVTGMLIKAFQVTEENIGALAVDFGTDLCYSDGYPTYFTFYASRVDDEDRIVTPRKMKATPGVWIIAMRGQFYIFSDQHFRATFAEGVWQTIAAHAELTKNDPWMDAEQEDRNMRDPIPSPHPRPNHDLGKLMREERTVTVEDRGVVKQGVIRETRDYIEGEQGKHLGVECYVEYAMGEGGNWFHEDQISTSMMIPGNSLTFKKGDRVSLENDAQGTVIEGPNEHGNYYIRFDSGGLSWYAPADLRLVLQNKQETEQI